MEVSFDISRRWTPADTEYMEAVKYMNIRKYHQALERLHKLVVQRLYEMHKLNLSGTGMIFFSRFYYY